MKTELLKGLNFFKKGRDYIQGPDIYNYISKHFLTEREFIKDINFKKKINSIPKLILANSENFLESFDKEIVSYGKIFNHDTNKNYFFYLYETNIKIIKEIPFDEDKLKRYFFLKKNDKEIYISNNINLKYSTLEIIISMKKYMCNNLFGDKKKWIFTSLTSTDSFKSNFSEIKIKITQNIKNSFIISNIYIDNNQLSKLTFLGKYE